MQIRSKGVTIAGGLSIEDYGVRLVGWLRRDAVPHSGREERGGGLHVGKTSLPLGLSLGFGWLADRRDWLVVFCSLFDVSILYLSYLLVVTLVACVTMIGGLVVGGW
ncbi:hypothetical protein ASPBRDRAFT_483304 [Aspergillus brasiliensis CBS 101740]|uniref:Uncharacterized protein n=1 Tax=Aspergillus brasiliensis (strain CBS 101740 / IMI 381727 / IBT 21946) TaxID=767769 RepID=A0A1L9UUJ0_ASPBC|nr:hypothetical protein ASPBRDRAFT_483304 [Aspergillus brasiliensis CBS 101740]